MLLKVIELRELKSLLLLFIFILLFSLLFIIKLSFSFSFSFAFFLLPSLSILISFKESIELSDNDLLVILLFISSVFLK